MCLIFGFSDSVWSAYPLGMDEIRRVLQESTIGCSVGVLNPASLCTLAMALQAWFRLSGESRSLTRYRR